MSISSLSRPGGLPEGLSALLGQLSPVKSAGKAAGKGDDDFDTGSANAPGAGGAASTALTDGTTRTVSDQTLGFLSKLQEQSSSQVAPRLSALEGAAQFSSAIRAFESASSATTAAAASLSPSLGALWQSSTPASTTTNLMA